MKRYLQFSFFKICILTVFILFITTSFVKAQTEVKISLTGFNQDVIADGVLNTLPSTVTTNDVDYHGYVYFVQGYSNNTIAYLNGLPATGQFLSSDNHNFQLASYTANNDLKLQMSVLPSATLAFAIPDQIPYSSLFVLASSANGSQIIDYTITFSDASTTNGSFTIDDWGCSTCTPFGIRGLDRVNSAGTPDGGTNYGMWDYPISLSVLDQAKNIVSIHFTILSGTATANIFGITGISTTTLPVTLEYYTARVENGKALLQWKTSQELNNRQFIIERSTSSNPSSFVTVGNVNASPSANGSIYQFTNDPVLSGTYFYRLSQEDIDGNIKILGTKSLTFNGNNKWVVQDLGYQWKLICEQPFTYRVLDFQGRIITSAKGSGSATITKPAANGIYQIQVQTGGRFSSQSLLK
jgi:hypothetical protein